MHASIQISFLLFLPLLVGAKTHWSLLPPERPSSGKSIDEFITKKLSEKGLRHSDEACKAVFEGLVHGESNLPLRNGSISTKAISKDRFWPAVRLNNPKRFGVKRQNFYAK